MLTDAALQEIIAPYAHLGLEIDDGAQPWIAPTGPIAGLIDHTLLKPTAQRGQLEALAVEARAHRFASVCVNSANVPLMKSLMEGSGVPVCAVVGFPLGAMYSEVMAYEANRAVQLGAEEIDMVIPIGPLKDRRIESVIADIEAVVGCGVPVKVILETCFLTEEEKVLGCAASVAAKAAFVKTSTGFGGGGATEKDIALMRRIVGPDVGVKASGGVRDRETALRMIEAGASRIGASASVAIIAGEED